MNLKLKDIEAVLFMLVVFVCFTACGTIFDYEGDCSVNHSIKFKYDKNILFADAFSNTVTYVNLFVFDVETGELISTYTEEGEVLTDPNYVMPIDVEPGEYDLVAWCGDALSESTFVLESATMAQMLRKNLMCKINSDDVIGDTIFVSHDIKRLWHGAVRVNLTDKPGNHISVLSLTKNTNNVRILLQNLAGKVMTEDIFDFKIYDNNGLFDAGNNVIKYHNLVYLPWSTVLVESNTDSIPVNNAPIITRNSSVSGIMAEFTISRLVVENSPILAVYNKETNKKILSIPLKDYILMVKGKYNENMSDQEYLDREDEFVMTFFIDESGNWLSKQVIINSWHLILQDEEELN